ncbi:MAG TPA: hypothetical protein V6C97_09100 [Oculatellaceae cyanobacterium]
MGEQCNFTKGDVRYERQNGDKHCAQTQSNLLSEIYAHPENFIVKGLTVENGQTASRPTDAKTPTGTDNSTGHLPSEKAPVSVTMPKPAFVGTPQDNLHPGQNTANLHPVEIHDSQSYEINHLKTASVRHDVPDAMVRIPKNFDPTKPINLVVYNHGYYTTAEGDFNKNHLDKQMEGAPPNTVLIVPEWQTAPGSKSPKEGNFANRGQFDAMVQDIFNHTPELKGKTLNDVGTVGIVSHSAGFIPTEAELYNNKLSAKVNSVTLLDSLYRPDEFDSWIQNNIKDLASGRKQFTNIYFDTGRNSQEQASRVKYMLNRAGLPGNSMLQTSSNIDSNTLSHFPIVFKQESRKFNGDSPHYRIPAQYLSVVEDAAAEK